MYGTGSFNTTNNISTATPPGPPFVATSAENGLSVDPVNGKIVLGNDNTFVPGAGQLLSSRDIALNAFSINLFGPVGNFQISDNQITVQNFAGPAIGMSSPAAGALLTLSSIAPAVSSIDYDTSIGGERFAIVNDAGKLEMKNPISGNRFLSLDQVAGVFRMGDLNGFGTSSIFKIDDPNRRTSLSIAGINYLFIDVTTKSYEIGDATGDFLLIDGVNQIANLEISGNNFLRLNMNAGTYAIGDLDTALNGSNLEVDDTSQEIKLFANNGIRTTQPSANGNELWKLGKVIAAATVLDNTKYVETMIGGIIVKLAVIV